jgi:dihydrofolate reductase
MASAPSLSIVVAAAENNVIGRQGQLPWRLPDDLKRFKALTLGKPMIMGRKTFESIGRPLPGRTSIVISRQPGLDFPGCTVVDSLDAALAAAGAVPEIMVVGGAEIYRQVLAQTTTVHLTRVHASVAGDTFFPELEPRQWREVGVEPHPSDERHAHAFSFITLQRIVP